MQKNAIIAIAAIVVLVAAGAGVAVVMTGNPPSDPVYYDNDVRLKIYGNANGDDYINHEDVAVLQNIINGKISNWQETCIYADANQDGKIDSADVDVVNKIINKEKVKMYYESAFSTKDKLDGTKDNIVAYVNYPIGHKVGCEYSDVDILAVLGVYDYFSATTSTAKTDYSNKLYPGISDLPIMGEKDKINYEQIKTLKEEGKIDTLIQWTGGTSVNYLWDDFVKSGLADEVSLVMVTVQGEHCINGALMLACMLGDQSLSAAYKEWYANAMNLLDRINLVEKKTCLVMKTFNKDVRGSVSAYNQYQPPALWFSKIVNFTDQTAGKTGFTELNSAENIEAAMSGIDTILCQTKHRPADTNQTQYNTWFANKMADVFTGVTAYNNHKVYSIDFSIMPFFGGPAGCILLAAQLYPTAFTMAEAQTIVNNYCAQFMPPGSETAKGMDWGYTYTGWGA